MDVTPLDQATAILGEHFKNYVVIFQEEDNPTFYDLRYSDPYAAKGLLESCVKYHNTFLEGGEFADLGDEWVWEDEDDDDDDDDDDDYCGSIS
jgi:hypothetical protein